MFIPTVKVSKDKDFLRMGRPKGKVGSLFKKMTAKLFIKPTMRPLLKKIDIVIGYKRKVVTNPHQFLFYLKNLRDHKGIALQLPMDYLRYGRGDKLHKGVKVLLGKSVYLLSCHSTDLKLNSVHV